MRRNEHVLLPQHKKLLDESGISPEVAEARGYRSVSDAAELQEIGFAGNQCRVPALLIPVWGVIGKARSHQIRPDKPRKDGKGKDVKYETPTRSQMALDVHPSILDKMGNPKVPIYITEGIRKADAAVSRGLCCIALLGVWNWRGTNEHGGKTALPDWEAIALNGRPVYICFDSDVMLKPEVQQAMLRLKDFLEMKGAEVRLIYLPSGEGEAKVGLDDYLAAGHSVKEMLSLAEVAPAGQMSENAVSCEIMDDSPACISRPLCLVGGYAYAATWIWTRQTIRRTVDKRGNVETHDPPIERNDQTLVVIRGDGQVFTDEAIKGARLRSELGVNVHLPETPPAHRLWSGAGVKRFMTGERPDAADVFRRIVDIVGRFIDFNRSLADQETMCDLVGCYILATYLLDGFNVIGYLWPNGDRGTGKTHFLHTVAELAYLGQVILAGGTHATLRDMADYGATLAFDDAEGIMDVKRADPDKRSLLLAGNRRGTTIAFKEPASTRGWTTRHVHTFCPRLFSAIRLPDEVLASRTITIPLVRSGDPKRSNADPLDYSAWPHDHARLKDDLWAVGLSGLPVISRYDKEGATRARLSGRDLQPWRAILAVALWLEEACGVSGLFQRMEGLSVAYQGEREELETSDPTRLAILALWELISDRQTEALVFGTSELAERMNDIAIRHEIAAEGESYSSPKRVGWLLKRLRFEKETPTRNARRWKTKRPDIQALARSYGMTLSSGENADNAENVENADDVSTFSTFSTLSEESEESEDQVLEAVSKECRQSPPERACFTCRQKAWWWQEASQSWVCGVCHPKPG